MADNLIKWKQGDYVKLGKAVANFNKKINALQNEENKLYLPENLKYNDLKSNIKTRKELNRIINSLNRFKKEGSEELYITEAGEQMTKWERRELGIQSRIAQMRLTKELSKMDKVAKPYRTHREIEINAQLKNLKSIEKKKGVELSRLKQRIKTVGTSDYVMRKSIIFQENYLREMEKYSGFANYDKLMEILKAIRNPISFFEFVSQNEITGDLTYQSDQTYSQKEFNKFVERFGINTDDVIGELDEKGYL